MWNIQKVVSKGDYNYAYVPEHPNCTKTGYVLHHRVVMENHLGRLLNADEVVHHINGDKKDNRVENLEVLGISQHSAMHGVFIGRHMVVLKCPWCGKIFKKRRNDSFLSKKQKYDCNCCSSSCRGKLYRDIQLHGLTAELEKAVSENLLAEYIEYTDEDNSEETYLT